MSPAGNIVKRAYLDQGISNTKELMTLSGLAEDTVQRILNQLKKSTDAGDEIFTFLPAKLDLGSNALKLIKDQRESLAKDVEKIEMAQAKYDSDSPQWAKLQQVKLQTQKELRKVSGADIAIKVAEARAVREAEDEGSPANSSAPKIGKWAKSHKSPTIEAGE